MLNHYTEIIPTRWGNMLSLKCDSHITGALSFYGESTPHEVAMCLSFLKQGDTVLDVGANIGTFTVPMALAVGRSGSVISFEPQRIVNQVLCANLALNSLCDYVEPLRLAVGASAGTAKIPLVNPFFANNNVGGVRLNQDAPQSEPVEVITIDSLNLPSLALIKIDVEGMEHEVLNGASETVKRCKPAIFAECLPGDEANATGLKKFFAEHGYKAWLIVTPLFPPDNVRLCSTNIFGTQSDFNVVAVPNECANPVFVKSDQWFA